MNEAYIDTFLSEKLKSLAIDALSVQPVDICTFFKDKLMELDTDE